MKDIIAGAFNINCNGMRIYGRYLTKHYFLSSALKKCANFDMRLKIKKYSCKKYLIFLKAQEYDASVAQLCQTFLTSVNVINANVCVAK